MLMEGDPFLLIEGMAIAGLAVGATKGYVYIRSEYPHAFRRLLRARSSARARPGLLGADVLGSGHAFDLEARLGAGAYICGEETSLLESLEGKRGQVRAKPPLPAISGLFGKPTVINNVLSFASVPWILEHGAQGLCRIRRRAARAARSRSSSPAMSRYGGLVELAFGATIRELVEDFGGGTRSGRPIRAVQVGGPLGAYFPESLLDTPLDYEAMARGQGHARPRRHRRVRRHASTWRARRVSPSSSAPRKAAANARPAASARRAASRRSTRSSPASDRQKNVALLRDLCEVMTDGSLCALGGLTPLPVLSALDHFREDFASRAAARRGGIGGSPWRSCRNSTPARRSASGAPTVTLTIDGREVSVPREPRSWRPRR